MNSVLKFADDTKLFGVVENEVQHQQMQRDLCTIVEWSRTWQMEYNIDNCKILHIGGRNDRMAYSNQAVMVNQKVHPSGVGKLVAIRMQRVTAVEDCEGKRAAVRWLACGLCSRTTQTTTRLFPAVSTGALVVA
jgi:hypothetical protein